MSLVNEMLQDLEQRRQKPDSAGDQLGALKSSARDKPTSGLKSPALRWAFYALLAVGMIGFGIYEYYQSDIRVKPRTIVHKVPELAVPAATVSRTDKETGTDDTAASSPEQSPSSSAPPPAQPLIDLQAMQWQEPGPVLVMTFNRLPAYRFSTPSQQTGRLVLQDVGYSVDIKSPLHPLVRSIGLSGVSDGVVLDLETKDIAAFSVEGERLPNGAQLRLNLSASPSAKQASLAPSVATATAMPRKAPSVATTDTDPTASSKATETKPTTSPPTKSVQAADNAKEPMPVTTPEGPVTSAQGPAVAASKTPPVVKNPTASRSPVKQTAARATSLEQRDSTQVETAQNLVRRGRSREAEQQLREFLTREPTAIRSRAALAGMLMSQQRWPEAQLLLERGPEHPQLTALNARLWLEQGQPRRAWELLRDQSTQQTALLSLRAAVAQQLGHYQQSEMDYLELLGQEALQPRWWMGLALALEGQQRGSEAARAYRNILKNPDSPAALVTYARQRIDILEP